MRVTLPQRSPSIFRGLISSGASNRTILTRPHLLLLNSSRHPISPSPSSSPPPLPRPYSTPSLPAPLKPRRSLLYVPGSDPKKLIKSQGSKADALIFDLEDSVAKAQKGMARSAVFDALQASKPGVGGQKFVRINSGSSARDDLEIVLKSPQLEGIVIPKVNSAKDVMFVDDFIREHALEGKKEGLKIIASIESPLAVLNLREIATCSKLVDSLLFAAEDYCASSNLLRSPSRHEMLYVRSAIVTHAKAFGLRAIDLVHVNYGDLEDLRVEAEEGRRMGFDGKQAIHPTQVDIIQKSYSPSAKEIKRAVTILHQYEIASKGGRGAYGLTDDSGTSMIDAPMLLQANSILAAARAGGLDIPELGK